MKRILIIGFPRSGTTLLQTLLGAHPHLAIFPESHILSKALVRLPLFSFVVLRRRASAPLARVFLESCGLRNSLDALFVRNFSHWDSSLLPRSIDLASSAIELFDQLAELQGKSGWLEKTPDHLFWWDAFAAVAPDTWFIHIQRRPEDAVASFFKAAKAWSRAAKTLPGISRRWNKAMKLSLACAGAPNHLFVTYESLVKHPHDIAEEFARRLELPKVPRFSEDYDQVARKVILPDETHKMRNTGKIIKSPSEFPALSEAQRRIIIRIVDGSLYHAFDRVQTAQMGTMKSSC